MTNTVQFQKYYLHQDGGLYYTEHKATLTTDGVSDVVVYYHIFPFETKRWARPIEEWTPERFKMLTSGEEVTEILNQDREQYQKMVAERKTKRKAAENAAKDEWLLNTFTE